MNGKILKVVTVWSLLLFVINFSDTLRASDTQKTFPDRKREIAKFIENLSKSTGESSGLEKTEANLVSFGDEAIDPIVEEIYKGRKAVFDWRAIRVLKSIGTPKAQQALLDVALKKDSHFAALSYIEISHDKSSAKKLLISEDPNILTSALSALRGIELDEAFLEKLQLLVQSSDAHVRIQAAKVISTDPTGKNTLEKLNVLMTSIETAEQVKDSHKKFPNPKAIGTISDDVYFHLIDALSETKGIDDSLKHIIDGLQGKAKYCVIIARANRGDISVKQDLYNIIKDPNAGMLKCSAVIAFDHIGTPDDIPFLREVALTDTLAVEPPQGYFNDNPHDSLKDAIQDNKFYPVRFWAQRAIKEGIKKKSK